MNHLTHKKISVEPTPHMQINTNAPHEWTHPATIPCVRVRERVLWIPMAYNGDAVVFRTATEESPNTPAPRQRRASLHSL